MSRIARPVVHFAARHITGRLLRRGGLLRLLPSGFVAALMAEGLLLAWQELRARPELRKRLWQSLSAGMSRRLSAR